MDNEQIMAALQQLIGGGNINADQQDGPRGVPTSFIGVVNNAVVCPTKLQDGSLVSGLYYPNLVKKADGSSTSKLVVTMWNNSKSTSSPSSTFKVTFWDKYADIFARCLSAGQFIDLHLDIQHTYYDDPSKMETVTVNGVQTQRPRRVYYTENRVRQCFLHQESAKTVASEIGNWPGSIRAIGGKLFIARPPMWNVPGHPDSEVWKQIRAMRTAAKYNPGDRRFGYCAVIDKSVGTGTAYGAGNVDLSQLTSFLAGKGIDLSALAPKTVPVVTTPANNGIDMNTLMAMLNGQGGGVNYAGGDSLQI
jgi:hypothetical protein